MEPIKFEKANANLGEGQDEYITLPAFIDFEDPATPITVGFKLTDEERKQVAETGEIWISQLTFRNPFHPIAMSVIKPDKLK